LLSQVGDLSSDAQTIDGLTTLASATLVPGLILYQLFTEGEQPAPAPEQLIVVIIN
jgi:hypothetical protein